MPPRRKYYRVLQFHVMKDMYFILQKLAIQEKIKVAKLCRILIEESLENRGLIDDRSGENS